MMRALLITLIVVSAPCAALAQIDQDWKSCKAEDPDDATVSACTHLIETNELGPNDRAVAYCHRGAAYWRKGDSDKALADESKAIEINPEFADAYMTRGAFFVDTGDYDQLSPRRAGRSRSTRETSGHTATALSPADARVTLPVLSPTRPKRSRSTRDGLPLT